ncbi:hypothetical protein ABK040_011730 [Willaertia magna]
MENNIIKTKTSNKNNISSEETSTEEDKKDGNSSNDINFVTSPTPTEVKGFLPPPLTNNHRISSVIRKNSYVEQSTDNCPNAQPTDEHILPKTQRFFLMLRKEPKKLITQLLRRCCSIAFLFPLLLVTIVIVTVLIVWLINFLSTSSFVDEMSFALSEEVTLKIKEKSRNLISMPPRITNLLKDFHNISYSLSDIPNAGRTYSWKLFTIFPEVSSITLANETNEMLVFERYPNKTVVEWERDQDDPYLKIYQIDPRTAERRHDWGPVLEVEYYGKSRRWYIECKEAVSDYWTGVYFFATDVLGITRCTTIPSSTTGEILGVATADLSLQTLNSFLNALSVAKTGTSFILERSGYLIATSNKNANEVVGRRIYAPNATDPIIRDVSSYLFDKYNNFHNVNVTSEDILVGGGSYFVGVSYFYVHKNIDWLIVVVIPKNDFLEGVQRGYIVVACLTVFMIILSIILSSILSYCITKPLYKLRGQMKKITKLNLDDLTTNKKKTSYLFELQTIELTFISMVYALQSFKKYVPDVVIKRSMRKNEVAELYLVERELSIFFMDFVEFTRLTEELQPIRLIELISEAMEEMSVIIEDEGGVIDKYIGDAIMALFNAPYDLPDFEIKACMAALRCIKTLDKLGVNWIKRGLPTMKCRIGINSGKALVGNFGSTKRLSYTAIGHNVNLGARLEPLCKYYETNSLISQSTYEKAKEKCCCKFIDVVVVKGTTEDIAIYEILEERTKANIEQIEIENITNELLFALKKNDWEETMRLVLKAMKVAGFENNKALEIILERCKKFEEKKDEFVGILSFHEKSF